MFRIGSENVKIILLLAKTFVLASAGEISTVGKVASIVLNRDDVTARRLPAVSSTAPCSPIAV